MVAVAITAAAIGGDVAVEMGLAEGLEINGPNQTEAKLAGFAGVIQESLQHPDSRSWRGFVLPIRNYAL